MARFSYRRLGVLQGYAALDKKRDRVSVTLKGKPVSVKAQDAVLVARNNGYRTAVEANS